MTTDVKEAAVNFTVRLPTSLYEMVIDEVRTANKASTDAGTRETPTSFIRKAISQRVQKLRRDRER